MGLPAGQVKGVGGQYLPTLRSGTLEPHGELRWSLPRVYRLPLSYTAAPGPDASVEALPCRTTQRKRESARAKWMMSRMWYTRMMHCALLAALQGKHECNGWRWALLGGTINVVQVACASREKNIEQGFKYRTFQCFQRAANVKAASLCGSCFRSTLCQPDSRNLFNSDDKITYAFLGRPVSR